MANYIFNPPSAPRRKYTIKPTWDGHYTGINANGDTATFSLKYSGYLRRPETPGYSKMHYEYECDGEQTITADEGWENNKPTEGSKGGVCGYCGNSYLIIFGGYWREDGLLSECYNYDNESKSGNFSQTNISYNASGEIIDRTVDTYDFDIIDTNNSSFKGRWWPPIYNAFPIGNNDEITELVIEANFPIFDNYQHVYSYLASGGSNINGVVNAGETDVDETTKDYYIYNRYQMAHVERGIVTTVDSIVHQQNERILYNGERGIALYRDTNNPFKFNMLCDTSKLVGSIYSNTSVSDVSSASYDEFTLDTLLYDGPFYSTYNARFDIFTYDGYLGQFDTNLPLWDSEQDAQDYLDGTLDITQSPNWDKISSDNIWKGYTNNKTGEVETATEMGQSYAQNFFSQLYLCATGSINQIASALYDVGAGGVSGLWDEIKKGIEMYGEDPMQSIQGLMFFPLDLSSIYTNVSDQNYVYFGGYKLDLNTNVKKLIFPNGYKSLGTINIVRTFKDWRDFEPYTKLYIYLPYVGTFQLQLSRYYGKTTEIRYYFDLRTGSCLVALLANGILIDYFNGQLGVQLPITLNDKSNYANNQINTLLKGAGSIGSVIKDVSSGVSAGLSIPVTGAFGALQAGISVSKTVYDLTQNNKSDYNKTSGGSTSMLNEFLPQYAYFIFEIQQTLDSENVQSLIGFPSNKSGNVGEFGGYLEVETVNLKCGIATDNEKRHIENMLRTGVII